MDSENISFFELDNKSYLIIDQYIFGSKWYNYKDPYSYHNINVNNIVPYKKSDDVDDDKYVIRYIDKYRSVIAPLQLISNFFCEMEIYTNNDKVMFIYSDDKELFKKLRKIWNRITKLIGINNAPDFVKTDSNNDKFIMADVDKNTSFVEGNYEDKSVIVLDSVINEHPKTLLIQAKKHKCTQKCTQKKKHMINAPITRFF